MATYRYYNYSLKKGIKDYTKLSTINTKSDIILILKK